MRVNRAALCLEYWSSVQTSLSLSCLRLSQVVSAPLETGVVSLHLKRMGMTTSLTALSLAATVALSTAPVQAQVSFLPTQNFAVGDNPRTIVVGDLDRDGDLDLATSNAGTDNVSVLKNNGDGTFAAPQNFAGDRPPRSIVIGDLDRDGDLDLATANYSNFAGDIGTVSVFKNNGNGTFATPQTFAAGDFPYAIAVGDVDGDGDLDLATVQYDAYPDYTSSVSVLKNNGDGTFAPPQFFAPGYLRNTLTVGDLDGDGDLDIALAGVFSQVVSVLKNNGDGTFAAPQRIEVRGSSRAITNGDLDGDGDLDLVRTDPYNQGGSVLKNNGDGTFVTSQNLAALDEPYSITVGDLDGDGDLDIITGNGIYSPYTASVLTNDSNGSFTTTPQSFTTGERPRSIISGDLDGDGDLDVATANRSSDNVSVLLNTTPTLQLSLSPNRSNPVPLAGQTVSGNVYVFASGKDADFLRVNFYLDDPNRSGEPFRTELVAPFDLSGTSGTQARPSDSRALPNGEHTITATFARTDGTYRTITSTFTVNN